MPTYEYECKKCHFKFTVLKSMKDMDKAEKCPFCKKEAKKKVAISNFILKGDGFHNNDYPKQ